MTGYNNVSRMDRYYITTVKVMNQQPVIAIIGRPNVGKSSLFNKLLRRRQAIVSPTSGTTRDRLYAVSNIGERMIDLVDTAGLSRDLLGTDFGAAMMEQVQLAVKEAAGLVFILDGQVGITHEDQIIIEAIRKAGTPTVVFINKVDSLNQELDPKLTSLGLGPTIVGSIIHRRGINQLQIELQKLARSTVIEESDQVVTPKNYPKVALVGRPNVGKSSVFNALVGSPRVIVSDIPGTTRDMVDSLIRPTGGQPFTVIDTAGLRRRGKIGGGEPIERYSVLRSLQAIEESDLILLIVDASEGLTRGDVHVAMHATQQKKQLITVFNKIDLIDPQKVNFRRFPFLTKLPMIFISTRESDTIASLLELIQGSLHNGGEKQSQNTSVEK